MFGFAPMSSRPMGSAPSIAPVTPPIPVDPSTPVFALSTLMRFSQLNLSTPALADTIHLTGNLL